MEKMESFIPCSRKQGDSEGESKDVVNFDKSLQELKDLSFQLHYAAEYCESTYLAAQDKRAVVENTKEYVSELWLLLLIISDAFQLTSMTSFPRLMSFQTLICESIALNKGFSYVNNSLTSLLSQERDGMKLCRDIAHIFYLRLSDMMRNQMKIRGILESRPSGKLLTSMNLRKKKQCPFSLPVRDRLSIFSRGLNPTFHFQETQKYGRNHIRKPRLQGGDIFSLMRRARRAL